MWIRAAIVALFAAVIVAGMLGVISTNAAVTPQYTGLTISSFTASANPTSVGHTTYLNVTASGGSGTITYAFAGLPTGCHSSNAASLACSPTAVGTFVTRAYANDTSSDTASQTLSITVAASGTLTVGSIVDTVSGGVYTFSVSVTGGTSPYTYSWNFGDSSTSTLAAPTHSYSKVGAYTVSVTVTDSASSKASKTVSTSITVTTVGGLTVGSIVYTQPSDGTYDFSLSPGPSGGTAPYSYAWTFGDGGTSAQSAPSYTYSNTGTFTVSVTVTDSAHNAQIAKLNLVVSSVASNGGSGNNNSTYLWIIIIVIVVAVAVILVLLILRKRRADSTPPAQNPYDPNSASNAPYDYQYAQAPPPQAAPAPPPGADMYQPAPADPSAPPSYP
jgi:PKD repeat protein